ncbi:MAG: heavy metal translocating P-type ATPase, partial [Pseudomonadota bacterium]
MALDLQAEVDIGCPSGLQTDPVDQGDRYVSEQDFSAHVTQGADGFDSLRLIVRGAHCGGCMRKIENGIGAIEGVQSARFNLTTARLTTQWDPAECDAQTIREKLSSLGYAATLDLPDQAQAERKTAETRLLKAMAVAGFATMNVMMLSVAVWSDVGEMSDTTRQAIHIVSAMIALPALAYSGRIFLESAWSALKARQTNMDVPISLAIILATGLSLYETFIGHADTYFDASLMLVFLLLIGRFLDARLRAKAGDAAHRLAALRVSSATKIEPDGSLSTVPSVDIRPDDQILVPAGNRIPVDGTVLKGTSHVDMQIATGESQPVRANVGTALYAGTLNLSAPLEIEAVSADENSFLSDVQTLVEAGSQAKSRFTRLADKVARAYVPIVHTVALLTFIGWLLYSGELRPGLINAIAVLLITCPCALGLAVP